MGYTTNRFAIRTVKDGAITIGGKTFRPREWYQERDGCLRQDARPTYNDLPYRGELDGKRLAFGRFPSYEAEGEFTEYVWLWGSATRFFEHEEDWPGPNCIDGVFRWDWWYTEAEWQSYKALAAEVAATA